MLTLDHLASPALLSLAAKKAHRFLDRHSWYYDRTDAAGFLGRLSFNVWRLAEDLRDGTYQPAPKTVFPMPKRIEHRSDETERFVVRPLCTYPFRDHVVETAIVCLVADHFERQWGDPRKLTSPRLSAFGNRLHLVGDGASAAFSVGNSRLYRDWSDDYSAFVRTTENAFNKTLAEMEDKERVVLLCCDVKSFYPGVERGRLIEAVRPMCDAPLAGAIERVFGKYEVESAAGIAKAEALKLERKGLPQGAAHSGFWSNVYLASFDAWVEKRLAQVVGAKLPGFRLNYYSRYVDDLRVVGCYRPQPGAPYRRAALHPLHRAVSEQLKTLGLDLSKNKSRLIEQNARGTLLTTGQIAERMQTLKERLYLPLPPEDLAEAAKDLRLLFHAEVEVPNDVDGKPQPHLENPGVRPDSRRRFAAGRWVHVAKELDALDPKWIDGNRAFASELVHVWLAQPEQVQLLQHAFRLGLSSKDIRRVQHRMKSLAADPKAFGYFAYLAAFFLDRASARWAALPALGSLPLGKWADDALRGLKRHPVLRNKAAQYLLARVPRLPIKTEEMVSRKAPGIFADLVCAAHDGLHSPLAPHPAELAALFSAVGFIEQRQDAILGRILRRSSASNSRKLVRHLMLTLPTAQELAKVMSLAEQNGVALEEFALFQTLPPLGQHELIYLPILRACFRSPRAWCDFALRLANLLERPDAATLSARGLLHPFALVRNAADGSIALPDDAEPNLAFAGYAGRFGALGGRDDARAWCLPVGTLLHAAATAQPRALLGISAAQRFRAIKSLGTVLSQNGALPEAAGDILMRLFAWPGARVTPFGNLGAFRQAVTDLRAQLESLSTGSVTICDVRGPTPEMPASTFTVVLCQIRSYPEPAKDTTVRRALAVARIVGRERLGDDRPPNLVIFPEASVPVASLPTLRRFVRATGAVVLAGLEVRNNASGTEKLNELVWIVPAGEDDTRPLELRQAKIHPTSDERALVPPVVPANPPVIWRLGAEASLAFPQRLAAINCYEFTDLALRELLRGRVEALVIAANNKDVPTFDNLIEATHYDLFCHVLLVNAERYGGSAIRAPYSEPHQRRIFDVHGGELFAVNVCELDLTSIRRVAPQSGGATPVFKTPPANFRVRH